MPLCGAFVILLRLSVGSIKLYLSIWRAGDLYRRPRLLVHPDERIRPALLGPSRIAGWILTIVLASFSSSAFCHTAGPWQPNSPFMPILGPSLQVSMCCSFSSRSSIIHIRFLPGSLLPSIFHNIMLICEFC